MRLKFISMAACLVLSGMVLSSNSFAQDSTSIADPVMTEIHYMQTQWAKIKYQMPDEELQLEAIHKLETYAENITAQYPERVEPKIWQAIILSTDAGIVKGLSALGKVEKAKELLETTIQIDPSALDYSAYTSLGSLYYQVPGWPIAFGDDDEAEKYLSQAVQKNPNSIDANFFYGDFLLHEDREEEARQYLERGLMAPNRPDRALADAGRRQEIKAKLAELDED